jgi:hypothetical protein
VLLFLVLGVSMYGGFLAGTWFLRILLTVISGGYHSFSDIQWTAYELGRAPAWLDDDGGPLTSLRIDWCGAVIALLSARYLGNWGDRLWRTLVLELNWATPEDLAEYYRRGDRV